MTTFVPGTKVVIGGKMNQLNKKHTKIFLFIIIAITLLSAGCARWPYDPPGPGETEYKLKITVEVAGEVNAEDGLYYIVLDAGGSPADGPGEDIYFWEDEYYYVQLDDWGFEFTRVEEGSSAIALTGSSISDDEFQVIINLNDLSNPGNSIDFNVITTDTDKNTYDYLDNYLPIGTALGSTAEDYDLSGDSESEEDNFDIIGVTAEIVIL